MTDKLPKLLTDSIEQNSIDIDIITKKLKLPWLKLDIKLDSVDKNELEKMTSNKDWRKQWDYPNHDADSYQVKGWNGDVFFGPTDWQKFLALANKQESEHYNDEDSKCRLLRKDMKYDWYVGEDNYVRQQVQKLIPNDDDINLVNTYSLPPGGYVFPHRDYASDGLGLAKIYIALKWGEGNVFGMYGCGDIPIKEGDVILLNNYTLPHWVYNGSDEDRVVIDISANLHSPVIKDKIIQAFKRSFVH